MAVGGFSEIGRNCCAIKVDDEVVILDLGLHMEKYIEYTDEREDNFDLSADTLIKLGAVPDINALGDWQKKVVAICISHAHLDHVGAIPYLGNEFDCPIYGTPFTMKVLNSMIKDDRVDLRNDLVEKKLGSKFKVSNNIEIEFVNVTHSTPETAIIVIHTKYGAVAYANDFKLDEHPTLGNKTNIKRLQEIDIKALIVDCLYANNPKKTPSEMIAKQMLKEILLANDLEGKNIFVTTFSSQIARLKAITEIGKKMGRKVVFLGRSLAKYAFAAEDANITKFKDAKIVKYSNKVRRFLENLKNPENHLFVVTGHQGEPRAVLSKIVNQTYFTFKTGDIVIFSCQIIPVQPNYDNRADLENALKNKNVKIYTDIHVSGHASGEDHRGFFKLIKPENIIPAHGDIPRMQAMKKIAMEEGYKEDKIHFLQNTEKVVIK